MGKAYQEIDASIARFIQRQKLFFVATAPLAGDGLVNCSPKGLDSLRILDSKTLVYADVGGSGVETVAHIRENGRIVLMFCALEGPPKIFRFYGTGTAIEPGDPAFEALAAPFDTLPTVRNLVRIDVALIRDACGYGVPLYEYRGERDSLSNWVSAKTDEELAQYRKDNNRQSLDGLPGLRLES
mgnify:CR=1 FL=1